mgnify:CR=1 FL=1
MSQLVYGVTIDKRHTYLLDLPLSRFLWRSSEDIFEKSLTKGEIPLNDHL